MNSNDAFGVAVLVVFTFLIAFVIVSYKTIDLDYKVKALEHRISK